MADLAQMIGVRAKLNQLIRQFFEARDVTEVTSSILSQSAVTDPSIASIQTVTSPVRYLRTSPEFALKRLLSVVDQDVYELGPVFRYGEQGATHNPEFTMLEWYRINFSMQQLIDEVVELLDAAIWNNARKFEVQQLTYRQAFLSYADIDIEAMDLSMFKAFVTEFGLSEDTELDQDQWLDLIFSTRVQPQLTPLTVITHYPSSQAALAELDSDDRKYALRFEVFVNGCELANGFQELRDVAQQRSRFERDNEIRQQRDLPRMPLDERFLAALDSGLPPCSGVALGVDRLLQVITGSDNIAELLIWPWHQA